MAVNPSLEVRHLVMVESVARYGSFAATAQAMSFSPSAISQQISALEAQLGAILFERHARGVVLTDAGAALLRHGQAILAQLTAAQVELDEIVIGRRGSLRVGSFGSATSTFVVDALDEWRRNHPDVDIQFVDGEPWESVRRLRARQLDVAVVFRFPGWPLGQSYDEEFAIELPPGLACRPLLDDPLWLVLPRDHPLAAIDEPAMEDLCDVPLLVTSPWAKDVDRACREAGFEPTFAPVRVATGLDSLQTLAAAGIGVTFAPRLALYRLRSDLTARPLTGAPSRSIGIATAGPGTAARTAFCQLLVATAAKAVPPPASAMPPATAASLL